MAALPTNVAVGSRSRAGCSRYHGNGSIRSVCRGRRFAPGARSCSAALGLAAGGVEVRDCASARQIVEITRQLVGWLAENGPGIASEDPSNLLVGSRPASGGRSYWEVAQTSCGCWPTLYNRLARQSADPPRACRSAVPRRCRDTYGLDVHRRSPAPRHNSCRPSRRSRPTIARPSWRPRQPANAGRDRRRGAERTGRAGRCCAGQKRCAGARTRQLIWTPVIATGSAHADE